MHTDFIVASLEEIREAFCTQMPVEVRVASASPEPNETDNRLERGALSMIVTKEIVMDQTFTIDRASWWERLKRTLGFAPKPKDSFQHLTHARLTNVHELMIETVHKIVVGDSGAKISRDIVLPVMRRPKDPETRVGLVDKI